MKYFEKRFLDVYRPLYLGVIFIGVVLDLLTKFLVILYYQPHRYVEVLGDFFRMTLTFNTGFVFGAFQDNAIPSLVATGVAIIFLIGYRWKNFDLGNPWGWNLVMAGAFGNFLDKFFVKIPGTGFRIGFQPNAGEYIGVVDFLDFDWPDFLLFSRWPAFNVADSCVTVGLTILILTMKLEEEK
ncbi:lipoprotein signal peptidase [Leptospira adleri]|uniref:Lipoprotein signal peptidase n=1 Tax=Leptospira adleri TaxID=2023186 RepID=A0A2M9YP62_9LEPT|nr:lipoprotein signal peptidase [Leptospira adleri]PJZ53299.1 lipoprotein signal peptidase [Leptospira adleri]PJZ63893.1 lipoprotein signal peptidase [Leptospira adleri]